MPNPRVSPVQGYLVYFTLACKRTTASVSEPVRQLISQHNRDELERAAASVHSWSVNPGDCLANLGVDLAENGADFMASIWGYAGMDSGQVTVLPAVWVAPNSMEACFLDLPRVRWFAAQPGLRTV